MISYSDCLVYLLLFSNRYMNSMSVYQVTVYQVTRTGHENCDVTEGELLDITPLNVDDKKLVTLYDKDLTEGLNLLIGMSTFPSSSPVFSSLPSLLPCLGKSLIFSCARRDWKRSKRVLEK